MAKAPEPKTKRVRRTPEEARAHILAAAMELLLETGPDRLTLVGVAKRAGVSHGLVSHYFGSIDNMLETALTQRIAERREALLSDLPREPNASADTMLERFFKSSRDPVFGRLLAWSILSDRVGAADFAPALLGSGKLFADAVEAMMRQDGADIDREQLEVWMLIVMCAGIGYGLAGDALWRGLNRERTEERDQRFRDTIAAAIAHDMGEVD